MALQSGVGQSLRVIGATAAAALLASCTPASETDVAAPSSDDPDDRGVSREEQMRSIAEMYSVPSELLPEDVELVRYVTPEEQFDLKADCLEQEGFPPIREGGEISYIPGEDQMMAFAVANYVCVGRYPIDFAYTQPLTDAQWTRVYEHQVEVTVPCIRELGYEVADPPTLQTYLDTGPESRWNPVAEVEQQVTEDALSTGRWDSFEEFLDACPPSPPADELRGGG
ncbi:hypothetical protein [Serinicoccus hydrothermalis]|uniref:hypothetical protein n=1 Tax=Serinicoccus hydrothermalis TaxID=1758689 RepID=UPI0012F97189|nr:hypothetical protein [Serinicoccus hydrothermalis]